MRFEKGLGLHPPDRGFARVKYRLAKQAAVFKGAVAFNDGSRPWDYGLFEILADGKPLWRSEPTNQEGRPQDFRLDVAKVDILELRVHSLNTHLGLHAVWLNPYLLEKADSPDPDPRAAIAGPELFDDGPRHYLADLPEFDVKTGPWAFAKNGAVGNGQHPIKVSGVASPRGLDMHPPIPPDYTSVKYRLNKKVALFLAHVAINDSSTLQFGSAVFEVLGDGRSLWQSMPVGRPKEPQECRVDVNGVDVLELRVRCQGLHTGVHAVWFEPRLLQKADTPDS